jgi:hypothetical protein
MLTASEKQIFIETAAAYPHLKNGDATILAAFAQASARSFRLAKKEDTAAWEKAVRTMLALARSLRLTPISTTRAEALGRKRDRDIQPSFYEEMEAHEEMKTNDRRAEQD